MDGLFAAMQNKGFHLAFPNNVTLSTQFGPGNYCEHHNLDKPLDLDEPIKEKIWESENVEVAIWKSDKPKRWLTEDMMADLFPEREPDQVMGWVGMEDWLRVLDWCRNYRKGGNRK